MQHFKYFLRLVFLSSLFGWGAWKTHIYTDWCYITLFLVVLATIGIIKLFFLLFLFIFKLIVRWWIMRPSTRSGSAGWATQKEIRKARLYKHDGFFAGMHVKKGIFCNIESSGLVLSPAGGGKTVSFVVPALCHNALSMFVPDLKGTLACMTAKLRKKIFGHKVLCVNPAGMYQKILGIGARYNPLQILIDDWEDSELHDQLVSDAQSIAKQLHPDPTTLGENQYFRNGARKFLTFAFLYLVTISKTATLANALSLLCDTDRLKEALEEAQTTDYLNGDLSRLATDLLTKFKSADDRQLESFREGAVQALDSFSPSGTLAECTSTCDFRFADMKKELLTVYLIADPTRMTYYAPWLGLLSWCALTELIRYQNGKSVCFLCDEITNFKIEGLPSLLTLAREFKIKIWLIVQELEQWAHVYGRESLETLLSQTEVKIIMGTRSYKTCELISNMLGEATLKVKNHSLGKSVFDEAASSTQEMSRRLYTADEVRRTNKTILFVRDQRPVLLDPIGYHEAKPWSKWVGLNPLYGKPFKSKIRLRI